MLSAYFSQQILNLFKITIDMDKEFDEDLPLHPDLDSTLSFSEEIEENSIPTRKQKHKRTHLLTEYLSKKKKANNTKVKDKDREGVTGGEFQKQFGTI